MPTHNFSIIGNSEVRPAPEYFVFMPGWGFDGRVIELRPDDQTWIVPDRQLDPESAIYDLVSFLDRQGIGPVIPVGWSMGANLALDFTLAHPDRVQALYLLAMRQSWPARQIAEIRADLGKDPAGFMRNFYRKTFLGHQPEYREFAADLEKTYLADLDPARLEKGLDYLEKYDLGARSGAIADLEIPIYQFHGGKDIIAPPSEMASVPGAVRQMIKGAGHPLFLDHRCALDRHRKKAAIRHKFCRSADTYDDHAVLQGEIAVKMTGHLPSSPPATILEIGCGTGTYTALLAKRYPEAEITALDFADEMVARARKKLGGTGPVSFACADAEVFLRDHDNRFELITSNATLHWFDNLEASAVFLEKNLHEGGTLLCSVFGPETMRELQAGLQTVLGEEVMISASSFPDQEELERIFAPLFNRVEIREEKIIRTYPDLKALLTNIKKTGTAGWHPGRHLLNRGHFRELEKWFSHNYDGCRISYQVFMVNCRK
ncbi:MAG: alpha/beta fold hydrolase [Desulfurivibrionaceae bacterium]